MKPIYLYMENFMAHERSEIDMTAFHSALIVGKHENSARQSNNAGKSTIFRALEFCLFNECKNVKLDRLVRDDTSKCRVILDFSENDKIYRLSRSRTAKGVSDLSLYERTSYEDPTVNAHQIFTDKSIEEKFWKDISARRTTDTEESLHLIHKMNYKAFCNGFYFIQNDFYSGLAAATKTDRKKLLKESLQLVVFTHLHKITSARVSALSKDLDKKRAVFESIIDPEGMVKNLSTKLTSLLADISPQQSQVELAFQEFSRANTELTTLKNQKKNLTEQVESVLKKSQQLNVKVSNAQKNIDDLNSKRKNTVITAKALDAEIKSLKEKKSTLQENDFNKISELKAAFEANSQNAASKRGLIQSYKDSLVELNLPLPDESFCKHCRQPLTQEHRDECQKSTNQEIAVKEKKILDLKEEITSLQSQNQILNENLSKLEKLQKELSLIDNSISSKIKEVQDKKVLYGEYDAMIKSHTEDLDNSKIELDAAQKDVEASSKKELDDLAKIIIAKTEEVISIENTHKNRTAALNKLTSDKAIVEHSILEAEKSIEVKKELNKEIIKLEDQYASLPDCLEAFGQTGIPNFIIQTLLDDLQIESNTILSQIKPELQLAFSIEKVKGDGQIDDDLNIDYFVNSRARDYGLLGGAQQVSIMFALKLGVAGLLKRTLGASFEMLLIDEVDSAFDEDNTDALADIIKIIQKDYSVLVITHDNSLKDKFTHAILVEQNKDYISKAKVVTSW